MDNKARWPIRPQHIHERLLLFQAYEENKRLALPAPPQAEPRDLAAGAQTSATPRKKLFSDVPRIEGERVVLDRVVDADAAALRDLIDNPHVQRYLPTYLFEKQRDDVHETIALLYDELFKNQESLILGIHAKETGELAGLAEFYGLRDSLHKISMGYRLRSGDMVGPGHCHRNGTPDGRLPVRRNRYTNHYRKYHD